MTLPHYTDIQNFEPPAEHGLSGAKISHQSRYAITRKKLTSKLKRIKQAALMRTYSELDEFQWRTSKKIDEFQKRTDKKCRAKASTDDIKVRHIVANELLILANRINKKFAAKDLSLETDTRDLLTDKLLKQKSASYKEIITANYGEWPLRGLDIVSDDHLDERVDLIGFLGNLRLLYLFEKTAKNAQGQSLGIREFFRIAKEEYVHLGGRIAGRGDKLWINRKMPLNIQRSYLAHERRHGMQYLHKVTAIPAAEFALKQLASAEEDGTTDQEKIFSTFTQWKSKSRDEQIDYLLNGNEVQARLEQILALNYSQWPHMPLNKPELWAVLTNSGVVPPRSIQDKLNADTDYLVAQKKFGCAKAPYIVEPLNLCNNLLPSEKARDTFWVETLPSLYGDILQSFGDRLAYERMGFSRNDPMPFTILAPNARRIHKLGFADPENTAAIAQKAEKLGVKQLSRHIYLCRQQRKAQLSESLKRTYDIYIELLEFNLERLSAPSRPSGADALRSDSPAP